MTANDNNHRGLLPAGLGDLLPPDAAREAGAIGIAIERFAAFGYERVKPPLVEFEESLLGGPGAALAPQTFRLMDPVSQRMMGVRPDMTVQVARIAVTRLKHEPRPLRLSYGGNVIRVRGTALKPERQFAQVGSELIGVDSAEADAEAVLLAIDALRAADEDLPMTLDPVEYRGLEYQTGVSFSVFGLKGREELARGGRYSAGYPEDGVSEPATGFTLYLDAVLSASDTAPERPRLFLPPGTPWSEAAPWQAKGYAVVRGVTASADPRTEAKRLRCSHALIDKEAVPL